MSLFDFMIYHILYNLHKKIGSCYVSKHKICNSNPH